MSDIKTESETETITTPSQDITLNPFSEANVTHTVYKYKSIRNCLIDFEIDENTKCRVWSLLLPGRSVQYDLRFIPHFRNARDCVFPFEYSENGITMRIEYMNDKYIFRNYPGKFNSVHK